MPCCALMNYQTKKYEVLINNFRFGHRKKAIMKEIIEKEITK